MKYSHGLIALLLILVYVILGLAAVYLADLLLGDEHWHFTAAALVAEGKLPYRDFAYFHMPLVPYLYGLAFRVFASDVILGRLISSFLGLLSVIFIYMAARRLKGGSAALFAILPVVFNFNIVFRNSFLYCGAVESFLLSSFCLAMISRLRDGFKYGLCAALLVLVQGVRCFLDNTTLYTFLFVTFAVIVTRRNIRAMLAVAGSYIAVLSALYLPPLLYAPKEFLFGTLTHYLSTGYVFTTGKTFGSEYTRMTWLYDRAKDILSLFRNYYIPMVSLLLMAGCGVYYLAKRITNKGNVLALVSDTRRKAYLVFIMLIILNAGFYLAIFGHHLLFFPYHIYPLWAVLFGCACVKISEYFKMRQGKVFFSAVIVTAVVANFFGQEMQENINSPRYAGVKFLKAIAAAIETNTRPQDAIFTFENGYAVQAKRRIFADTIYDISSNSLFPKLSDAQAREHKLLSPNILLEYFKGGSKVIVLERPGRLERLPPELGDNFKAELEKALAENYDIKEAVYKYGRKAIPGPAVFIYKIKKSKN